MSLNLHPKMLYAWLRYLGIATYLIVNVNNFLITNPSNFVTIATILAFPIYGPVSRFLLFIILTSKKARAFILGHYDLEGVFLGHTTFANGKTSYVFIDKIILTTKSPFIEITTTHYDLNGKHIENKCHNVLSYWLRKMVIGDETLTAITFSGGEKCPSSFSTSPFVVKNNKVVRGVAFRITDRSAVRLMLDGDINLEKKSVKKYIEGLTYNLSDN